MNRNNIATGLIVLLLGLGLIAAGFFLFARGGDDERVFWLGMISVGLMYSVNVIHAFDFFGSQSKFESGLGGLGVKMFFLPLYSVLVIAIVLLSIHYEVEFRYQLYGQSILIFLLIVSLFLVQLANTHANSVQVEQDHSAKSKAEILNVLREFELWCLREPDSAVTVIGMVKSLMEEVRYISPTNSQEATEIDGEVLENLKEAFDLSKREQAPDAESILRKCQSLIQARKKLYSK